MDGSRDACKSPAGSGTPPGAWSAAFLLAQVGALAAERFGERMAVLGLTPPHAGILRLIASAPGINQRTLAERLGIFPSRLVALVDQLQERGLVERRNQPEDRRSHALYLTAAGRDALAAIGKLAVEHDADLLASLTPDERAQLAGLLRRVAQAHGLTPGVHPGYRRL